MNKESAPHRSTTDAAEMYKDGTYLQKNTTWHVEHSAWKAEHIRAILTANNVRANTVCEVGCGAGEILKQLAETMPDAHFVGYELSPQAFELCKTRESEQVKYHLKNLLDEDVSFDCLLCIDVFEHVEDYMGFLKSLRGKATYKVFHIPLDISVRSVLRGLLMQHRLTVGHLHYFTRETALATLRDCGYEVVDYRYTKIFEGFPSTTRTLRSVIGQASRRLLFSMSSDLMVKIYGECALLVLAK